MNIEKLNSAGDIVELLQECSLPVSDLKTDQRHVFFGGFDGGILKSCVGVELFDAMALLRSLAVRPSQRKKGMGAALVSHVETFCKSRGVQAIYLMTTTASPYFARLGYAPVSRESVPASIKVDPKGAPCTFRRRGLHLHQTAKRPSVLTVHNAVRPPCLPSILPFGQGGCRRPSPACVVGLDPRGGAPLRQWLHSALEWWKISRSPAGPPAPPGGDAPVNRSGGPLSGEVVVLGESSRVM